MEVHHLNAVSFFPLIISRKLPMKLQTHKIKHYQQNIKMLIQQTARFSTFKSRLSTQCQNFKEFFDILGICFFGVS